MGVDGSVFEQLAISTEEWKVIHHLIHCTSNMSELAGVDSAELSS